MDRMVEPELLDELPAGDRRARRSRKDLQRLNFLMGHLGIFEGWLLAAKGPSQFSRLVELGAGDGAFALKLARRLAPLIGSRKIVLVDRLELVNEQTCAGFQKLGWEAEVVVSDVLDWLEQAPAHPATALMANLLLHHFTEPQLRQVFEQAARHSVLFAACDPRRSRLALGASHLLGLVGCNEVTRHDAVKSVRAGFFGQELTRLWPHSAGRKVEERSFGLFSHGFLSKRVK